jgi:hypothetical protein
MRGLHFVFLSQLHAVTVIFTLLYPPFGKFFHIFQRPAQLGVTFYRETGARGEAAQCARCGQPFASRMHIEDLKQVEGELRIAYDVVPEQSDLSREHEGIDVHYQDVRPDRADALLFLRPAMRHPAQGEGRENRRFRAMGGIPLQQGKALPQGRQAVPAGRAS